MRKILSVGEEGFTLIELLVVIAVLGILAAIAIPRLGGVTDKARLSEAQSAIGSIKTALEMTYAEKNSYASADTGGYETASNLLANTDIGEYVDEVSSNWQYNIDAVTENYLVEVIGAGGNYPDTLKASITKGDENITTTTKNTDTTAGTLP